MGLLAAGAVLALPGCRALRKREASDEAIAAARQLALQGIDAQQRGRWDLAESLFAMAVLKCPHDERARFGYAQSLWQRGAWDKAVAHMEEAVRLSGHDPERLVQLGQMYRQRGGLDRAAQLAAQAIAADPNRAGAWALRGQVLQARGQFDEALASYHKALSLQTPLPDVQVAIAEIYSATQRPQRALATLQTLAASFPPGQVPLEIVVRQSQTLISLGRAQDAAQCLLAACQRTSPSADLLLELARAQHLAQDRAAARQTLAAALARQPQHPGCLALAHELGAVEPAMAAVEPSAKRR